MIIITKDDIFKNPEAAREQVLKEDFKGVQYGDHFYKGISTTPEIDAKSIIENVIEMETKDHISFFRLSKPGEETPAAVHPDTAMDRDMACVLYLTPGGTGGTAFWRHKETGLSSMRELKKRDEKDHEALVDLINKDSNDESKWDRRMLVDYKYNRFITYPTDYFHSRYPFQSEGFGDKNETARLIWVAFYNVSK